MELLLEKVIDGDVDGFDGRFRSSALSFDPQVRADIILLSQASSRISMTGGTPRRNPSRDDLEELLSSVETGPFAALIDLQLLRTLGEWACGFVKQPPSMSTTVVATRTHLVFAASALIYATPRWFWWQSGYRSQARKIRRSLGVYENALLTVQAPRKRRVRGKRRI